MNWTGALEGAATPTDDGWEVNEWVKKAVILYFPIQKMQTIEVGPFEFHDKIRLKDGYAKKGVRGRSSCHCQVWGLCG